MHTDITMIDECTIKKSDYNGYFSMAFANDGFDPSQ